MKVSTNTSDLTSIIDLPIHKELDVEFFYNFYEKYEATTEFNSSFMSIDMTGSMPRYNRLNFSLPGLDSSKISTVLTSFNVDKARVESNIQNIYSCEDVGKSLNTTVVSQDTELSDSLYQLLMRSASVKNITGNMSDIALKLAKSSDYLSRYKNELQTLSTSFEGSGARFIKDTKTLKQIKFENLKTYNSSVTINDKFLLDLLDTVEHNSWLGNSTSHGLKRQRALEIQEKARKAPYIISSDTYDTILNPVDSEPVSTSDEDVTIRFIGTLVYRQEIAPDGRHNESNVRLLDVLAPNIQVYVDSKIKLESKYSYWLHALYEIKMNVIAEDDSNAKCSIYFQSSPSPTKTIQTRDNTPPSPPVNFDIAWDYQHNNISLHWNLPVCKTKDIKYFQIYRRASITEAFELLQEYDFNDSEKKPNRFDGVLSTRVKTITFPMKYYIDNSFNKDSKFIYAITCMDARGFISNYSCQIEVSFDETKNKLIKKTISKSGAPMQYPNVFLKQDFFLDVIKVSKKDKIHVFFDPEYLKITKESSGIILDEIVTSDVGSYSINILDVNRAQFVSVPIKIDSDLQLK